MTRRETLRPLLQGLRRGAGIGLLVLLCALAAATVVVPRLTGAETYTITGRSMEPSLPLGSFTVVRPVDAAAIHIGDVITFQLESGSAAVATHRVVGMSLAPNGERSFVTRGDNNGGIDDSEPVVAEQLKGRLWYSIPLVGWVSSAVSSSPARGWITPLAAIALFGYGSWTIVRAVRAKSPLPWES